MSGYIDSDDSSQRVVSIAATMTFSFHVRLVMFVIFTKRKQ